MNTTALLPDQDLSIEKLESIFQSAFIQTTRDNDGDLMVHEGNMRTVVRLEPERNLLLLVGVWGLKSHFSETQKLSFINDLNNGKILVRFCMPRPDMLWCDYHFLYQGGVTPFQIVTILKRFISVCTGAVSEDTDGIIGSD